MPQSLPNAFGDVHPKMLAVSEERRQKRNAAERKRLAEQQWRGRIGFTIGRALELAHLTKQEMSYAMGYADQSALSRWIAGKERPLLDKLFSADDGLGARFYDAHCIASAEQNPRLEVTTTITVRRSA